MAAHFRLVVNSISYNQLLKVFLCCMAKNKNKQPVAPAVPVSRTKAQPIPGKEMPSAKSGGTGGLSGTKLHAVIAGCIALITWLFYKVCLDNLLTNWDDPGYIRDNALIKDTSADGIRNIFSTPIMGNYHPLTILSYAIEYSYVRLEPWLYHLDSVLLHIIVTVLVYYFVQLLTRKTVAAVVAAVLFGLHPMHVESVAWLAGRKDVLYGTFYMAACIAHLCYTRTEGSKRWKWYAGVIVLFICSLLAKPVAVTLPVTLLLIDYFEKQEWNKRMFLEKLPLLAVAVRSLFQCAGLSSTRKPSVPWPLRMYLTIYWNALRSVVMPSLLTCGRLSYQLALAAFTPIRKR